MNGDLSLIHYQVLVNLKKTLDEAMMYCLDENDSIPADIINGMAELHKNISKLQARILAGNIRPEQG